MCLGIVVLGVVLLLPHLLLYGLLLLLHHLLVLVPTLLARAGPMRVLLLGLPNILLHLVLDHRRIVTGEDPWLLLSWLLLIHIEPGHLSWRCLFL